MIHSNLGDRRRFIRAMAAAAGGSFALSFRTRASLRPAFVRVTHFIDTMFTDEDPIRPWLETKGGSDGPEDRGSYELSLSERFKDLTASRSGYQNHGALYGEAYRIADDLIRIIRKSEGGLPELILHGGNLVRSSRGHKGAAQLGTAASWARGLGIPFYPTLGGRDAMAGGMGPEDFLRELSGPGFGGGKGYYSHDAGGFHFIHLDSSATYLVAELTERLRERRAQLEWLADDLARNGSVPTVLVMHPSILPREGPEDLTLDSRDLHEVTRLIRANPQVVLALTGKDMDNRAAFIPGSSALAVTTCSPIRFPCGARTLDLKVNGGGQVEIESRFVQTRMLEMVEKSFFRDLPPAPARRTGAGKDRTFFAASASRSIVPAKSVLDPRMAPWLGHGDSAVLAVVSDPHVSTEESSGFGRYAGHFSGEDSQRLYKDVMDQIASGRHRVEFFSDVFSRDEESDKHYLNLPVDAVLMTGDLADEGRLEEAEILKAGMDSLGPPLNERCMVAIGNHDMYWSDFAPDMSASDREAVSECYSGYGPPRGRMHYFKDVTDWLRIVALDSVMTTYDHIGMGQDQLDWLEDVLSDSRGKAVIAGLHHCPWSIRETPPVMHAVSRIMFDFTPMMSAARMALQDIFARHSCVKLVCYGHHHGTLFDQYPKKVFAGRAADDAYTSAMQTPATAEYPCGYRLLKVSRRGRTGRLEYFSAYTRLNELRKESGERLFYRVMGTKVRTPRNYKEGRAGAEAISSAELASRRFSGHDLTATNLRGYKDGTLGLGLGNTGKSNVRGKIEFTL